MNTIAKWQHPLFECVCLQSASDEYFIYCHLQVELETAEDVEGVKPKVEKMQNFPGRGGVIITAPAPADSNLDFVSRFFCPKSGIIEVLILKFSQSFWG